MHTPPRLGKTLILLLVLFLAAFAGMVALFHQKSQQYAVGEARKQALDALLVHRAIHAYVTKVQRPEIYRLKDDKKLYPDYFSPMTMSFTFISRNVKDLLNAQREQHGIEPIYFKLASENPRNPINQADKLESQLLVRMNREGLQEYQDVIALDGRKYLYLAVPIERSGPGCMKCHGDPKDAPRELVAMYGDQAGFHEQPDLIRALISIRAPLDGVLAEADRMANLLSLATFLLLAAIYALIAFFSRRIDAQQRRILGQNVELEHLSVTDSLTGAVNRLGLMQRLKDLSGGLRRSDHPMAVLMLDLDNFKEVNDRYGHPAGDQALRRFVATLRENVRTSDVVGRWGGEEFLVIAHHLDLDNALELGEKLRRAVERADFGNNLELTTSIGVAELTAGESLDDLVARVDRALYAAKQAGRNRVQGAEPIRAM
jgi:diguanylate cyclase (GGDEF)-like protein